MNAKNMNKEQIETIEKISFEDGDFQEVPPGDIVAYNELRSCADLFRMYEDEALDISPSFQREVVWKSPAQTRFIDSLIKQLPIPSLCFSYGYKTEEWQVIDGLQRISSLVKFLDKDSDWILSSLPDIDPRISGVPVAEFHKKGSDLNKLKRRVENATLPVTVLRCDPSLESHSNYLFTIFHRLNTGGTKLNNQEIRNCIYSGEFNQLLRDLDSNKSWLSLNGEKIKTADRFRRQEIILRFFAFFDEFEDYSTGLARFLNSYMLKNRNISKKSIKSKRELFEKVVNLLHSKLGDTFAKQRIGLAMFEALLVGVGRNIDKLENEPNTKMSKRYEALKIHEEFNEGKLLEGLSKTTRVKGRLNAAVNIFS